jgi:hypothetical protein
MSRLIGPGRGNDFARYDSGTAFPPRPVDGDLFFRTDLDLLWVWRALYTEWRPITLDTAGRLLASIRPSSGAAMSALGTTVTLVGGSTPAQGTATVWEATYRTRAATAASSSSSASIRTTQFCVQGNTTSHSGYRCRFMFGLGSSLAGHRLFAGLVAQGTAIGNAEPDTIASYVGVIGRTTDTNLQISSRRSGAATYADAGASFPKTLVNVPLELWIAVAPNSGVYEVELRRLDTGATFQTDISSVDSPGVNSFMAAHVWINTSASTTAANIELAAFDCYTY